jgi:hypothetical protein
MTDSEADYYKTYYSQFLETKKADFTGNVWLAFAAWLLDRFGGGTIVNPTAEGLDAWTQFYKQQCEKNKYGMDVLMVRANDNVLRRSLVEPEMVVSEGYELYKADMIKRRQKAAAYKNQMVTTYKGFLNAESIDCMGAEDRDFMTQREWMAAEERRLKREQWLADNKDKFIVEAFVELDSTIVVWRSKYEKAIADAVSEFGTWDLAIPDGKKEKVTLAKKLKAEWRFKDAVSGLSVAGLDELLATKIAWYKAGLKARITDCENDLANFERVLELWSKFRVLGLEELNAENLRLRKEEKPVLLERTESGVRDYNRKMAVLNEKLKIIAKLIQMNTRGVRCMDDYRGHVAGVGDYFEF